MISAMNSPSLMCRPFCAEHSKPQAPTSVAPAWSRHLTDEDTLLTILCGGSGDDAERGYADADLPVSLRESMTSRFLDPLFAVEEE